ncbi:unnamed protein product [Auanema sp. JU1783]|nr:unnamed protein product [Auanema sp. JU1783]
MTDESNNENENHECQRMNMLIEDSCALSCSSSSSAISVSDTTTSSSVSPECNLLSIVDEATDFLPSNSCSILDLDDNANQIVIRKNIKVPQRSLKRLLSKMRIRSKHKEHYMKQTSSSSTFSSLMAENDLPDEEAPFLSKKKKYFTERNRNIFRKLLHPSYQERNVQYRRLFGHLVSDTDLFLISFSCAYQREILCQGRMYISQRHICFHANIFGWETCFAVPFDEITNMTKEKAALIFPNSIQFETKGGEKHFFASFGNREKTVTALSMVLERREKDQDIAPEEVWERLNSDKRYRGSKSNISTPASPMTTTSSPIPPFVSSQPTSPVREVEAPVLDEEEVNCLCDGHYGKVLLDQAFPLSVLELRELVFNNSDWFSQFNKVLKNSDYHSSDWAVDKDGQLNRTCTYTMALNHAMAPKSCIVNENQIIRNLNGSDASQGFVVNKETQNSGVPYAENFTVRCTYCVMRVSKTSSRLLIHGGIFYIKNIWALVKGYIEKTAYQGLEDHYAMLKKMLGEECQRRLSEGPNTNTVEDSSENESLSSSVEDPTTDSPTKQRFMNSVDKPHKNEYTHVPKDILENTRPVVKDSVITLDYTWHIRIIIGLLAGLVFIQLLVLVRMNTIGTEYSDLRLEMSKSHPTSMERMASSPSEASSNVIESLVDTVNRLTADVQRLKERQEL